MLMQKEMKRLIGEGFDLESLSYEFGIPIKLLQEYKEQLEREKRTRNDMIRIQSLKDRYEIVYGLSQKTTTNTSKTLTEKEEQIVQQALSTARTRIENERSCSKKFCYDVCEQIKEIQSMHLTFEQALEAYRLLNSEKIQKSKRDNIAIRYRAKVENAIIMRLSEAAKVEILSTDDLDELNRLRKILSGIQTSYNIGLESAKDAADRKIAKIRLENAMSALNNIKSKRVAQIIKSIADGTVDVEEAKRIIKEEAELSMKNKQRTNFCDEEKEERLILHQITNTLSKQASYYPIKYPKKAVGFLQKLCNIDVHSALSTVVSNLIERKEYKKANELCDKYEFLNNEGHVVNSYVRRLKNDIRYAEVSDLAQKLLQPANTPKEDLVYYDVLKKVITKEGIKLSMVSLGTNSAGTKNITLADIWNPEEQNLVRAEG